MSASTMATGAVILACGFSFALGFLAVFGANDKRDDQ